VGDADQRTAVNADEPGVRADAEFVQLFTKSQRRLFLLILTQLHDPMEAEEVLQNVNVIIWRKSGQFQPGTNFLAWAATIANFEVMKYRSRRTRERLVFSDEFLATVAEEVVERSDELERRRTALQECIQKLRRQDRELIEKRYAPGETGKNLAERIGRPSNSVYQSLGRIRRTLMECIQRHLAAEAR
jgi:RNA polymerase sigma-70 factor (ECF subfamily)